MKISTPCFIVLSSGWFATFISSCNLINPSEGIPAYIAIDTFSFAASFGQGSSSNRITDVWTFADGNIAGIYEIPKTFPVLDSGKTQLEINAGIWDNGIAETRVVYPFYYPDTVSMNLQPGKIYNIIPHFTYRPSTKFYFIEDFEAGNLFDKIGGDTNMIRTSDPEEVFEGSSAGAIYLDQDHNAYQGKTSESFVLTSGNPVYVELNYKCDQEFQVGIYGSVQGVTAFLYDWTINPKDYWNKIYLNMTNEVIQLKADEYQILIKAVLDSTRTESHIYLDNIKLVSY